MIKEDDDPIFALGSSVSLISCHGKSYEGEVIAFESGRRVLGIKCPSTTGTHSDVHFLNLHNVTDINVKKEPKKEDANVPLTPFVNTRKIEERKRKAIDERRRLVEAFQAGVPDEGFQVFLHLARTMSNAVTWEGKNIIVNKDVVISPPYRPENCSPRGGGRPTDGDKQNSKNTTSCSYTQELVDKYWKSCKS
ncbi:protein LSM12-like [Brevipalpus obovatus]|uniref:protein LSM12-like n=1 Tax=Brevipalpus obovatus TaxID=246614 RepID=UPI003D9E7431